MEIARVGGGTAPEGLRDRVTDRRLQQLREWVGSDPRGSPPEVSASLESVAEELERGRRTDLRLQQFAESLMTLASLDFAKTTPVIPAGTGALDAAAGCLQVLSIELAAYIAERQRVEQELEERVQQRTRQLLQASKMAAIGRLAAGVAHEINNPLAVILAFAQGLARRVERTHPELSMPIASILRESTRCKDLVAQLLTFSRVSQRRSDAVDVPALLENVAPLLATRARTQGTSLAVEVVAPVPEVTGDRAQLEQVLINLGVNAFDALGQGGSVRLRAALSGAVVAIDVTDDGPGMPDDVKSRIFEPFFTTKAVGKGTGLGLSLSYEVVQQHGGDLLVDSAPGKGTTMSVRLPVRPC